MNRAKDDMVLMFGGRMHLPPPKRHGLFSRLLHLLVRVRVFGRICEQFGKVRKHRINAPCSFLRAKEAHGFLYHDSGVQYHTIQCHTSR